MKRSYFTFGRENPNEETTIEVIILDEKSELTPRDVMIRNYGLDWCGEYESINEVHQSNKKYVTTIINDGTKL